MTKEQWLKLASDNLVLLSHFIAQWHPASPDRCPEDLPITAPGAEAFRRAIEPEAAKGFNPVMVFNQAIAQEDIGAACGVLGVAWLGVPESTSCWRIPGFREAVDLLDDLPEQASPEYPEPEPGPL